MRPYQITPVPLGRRTAERSILVYLGEPRPIAIEYRLWVLRNGERTIVIDSGLPPEEAARRGVTGVRDVAEALSSVNVDIKDVDTVVLTHLHWDHASNALRFPRATFVAQRAEFAWLNEPLREHNCIGRFYSDVSVFQTMIDSGRVQLLDGDAVVAEGVEAILVGGHTPGSQIVVVEVESGTAVVSSDAIPLNENFVDDTPNGIHIDVRAAIEAIERVRRLEPIALYTGHDPVDCLDLSA